MPTELTNFYKSGTELFRVQSRSMAQQRDCLSGGHQRQLNWRTARNQTDNACQTNERLMWDEKQIARKIQNYVLKLRFDSRFSCPPHQNIENERDPNNLQKIHAKCWNST